MTKVAAQVARK